jgi:hypothetical protein
VIGQSHPYQGVVAANKRSHPQGVADGVVSYSHARAVIPFVLFADDFRDRGPAIDFHRRLLRLNGFDARNILSFLNGRFDIGSVSIGFLWIGRSPQGIILHIIKRESLYMLRKPASYMNLPALQAKLDPQCGFVACFRADFSLGVFRPGTE